MCGFKLKYILSLATPMLALLLLSASPGQDEKEVIRSRFPYAELETTEVDMGQLVEGNRARGEVHFTNEGAKDLLIGRVRSSCGLLIATWPTEPIRQGERATIRFSYDTSRLGPFERRMIIHTNAYQKTLVVPVTGEVLPDRIKK